MANTFKMINFGEDANTTTFSKSDGVIQYNITFDNINHNYIVYAFECAGEPDLHKPYWVDEETHELIEEYIRENW